MELRLQRVDASSRPTLERFLQLHLYEIGLNPDQDGLIDLGEPLDRFFSDANCLPLFFILGRQVSGFALVKLDLALMGSSGRAPIKANLINEFHILRLYRSKGVGTRAADLLRGLHAGRWIATCWPGAVSVEFWRHVAVGRSNVNGVEYGPDEHKGFPGQYVWVIESAEGINRDV